MLPNVFQANLGACAAAPIDPRQDRPAILLTRRTANPYLSEDEVWLVGDYLGTS